VLSHPYDNGQEFLFQIGESGWSKVLKIRVTNSLSHIIVQIISVEAPAADIALVVSSRKQKTDEVHVGLSWSEGIGKYKLTKVITIAPRFLIKNNLPEALSFREHGVAPRDRSVIKSGERCPLYVIRMGEEKLLTIAFSGLNTQWLVRLHKLSGLDFEAQQVASN
jgi:vacuolar protein sorting-associated protein 13A/C